MKKLFVAALLLFSTNVFAQSDDWGSVRIPMMDYAKMPGYTNYKTYDLLTFSHDKKGQELYGGRYTGPLYNWTSNPANADFKIILEQKTLKVTILSMANGIANLSGEVKAKVKVFDKDGKLIYDDLINAMEVKFSTDKYATKDELKAGEDELFRETYHNVIPVLLKGFKNDVTNNISTKGEPMLVVKKAKNMPEADKMNAEVASIQSIKVEDPKEYRKELESHKEFWKDAVANAQGDNASFFKGVALYNLAFLNIFTDDFKGAMGCIEQLHSTAVSKDAKTKIGRIYEIYQKKLTPEPPMIHSADYTSKVSIEQLLSNIRYLGIDGELELNDGKTLSGKILISRINMHETESSGIVSLDKADYWVQVGDEKVKLSAVKSIKGSNGNVYLYGSGEIKERVYTSSKIDLYKTVFPEETNTCYFQKSGGKLESSPIIGGGKWLKKLFEDCPELIQKIDSKQIKSEFEMGRYYGDSCK